MPDEKKEKKKVPHLDKVLKDLSASNAKRVAKSKAARTKMRSDRAKSRRLKRKTAASENSVTGLKGLRGFAGSKK